MQTGLVLSILYQYTLGAFSAFSFLTISPCCATRSYRPEEEEDDEEGAGEEEAGIVGAIPGLYS